MVSTHAPARGATWAQLAQCSHSSGFNSRAREGRDFTAAIDITAAAQVSTHAPARGATSHSCRPATASRFQLTRPRGARQACWCRAEDGPSVSTHAPARGATRDKLCDLRIDCVSTHAPARGATQTQVETMERVRSFNSRAREGRDSATSSRAAIGVCFNSRAREGRDAPVQLRRPSRLKFQLTRPRGARRHVDHVRGAPRGFQLTRPRGARHEVEELTPADKSFNSRAREGRDC